MENGDLQSLMSLVTPPGGKKLGAFIRVATKAVRGKSDADLASAMGVSASTIANWKRRGAVADTGRDWFQTRLIETIFINSSEQLPRAELAAVEAVTAAIVQAKGNPVGVSRDAPYANALAFAAMLAWSQFVLDAWRVLAPPGPSFADEAAQAIVQDGIALFRNAAPIQPFI